MECEKGNEREYEKRRIALIGIIVEDMESIERMNRILHEAGEYIVGMLAMPFILKGNVSKRKAVVADRKSVV